jgi:hypothetical protein
MNKVVLSLVARCDCIPDDGDRPDLAFLDHNVGKGLTGIDIAREARKRF